MCIVQKIVEEHGGETAVSSERGVGTTVRFLLPLETESVQDAHRPTAEVARGGRP
jgi:signal transduction histidine kinase